ncbi:MAG: nucleotidyltransferase [Pyramidobacter sp.]
MKFTESELQQYAAPLSATEEKHCKNAIAMVRDALKPLGFTDDGKEISPLYEDTYAYALEMRSYTGQRRIKLLVQGSYANNTNIRGKSDVDVAVIQEEIFWTEYRTYFEPQKDSDYGFSVAPTPAISFKDEVEKCLRDKFGNDVERKNKSIKVHGNTYRKDADTVPCRRYRDYTHDYRKDPENYIGGIIIFSDYGEPIINFPEQHIANGKKKNVETNYYYKKMVRIIKYMRYFMEELVYKSAEPMSSFGLESLLWNVPAKEFTKKEFTKDVSYGWIFNNLLEYLITNIDKLSDFYEANGIKKLCPTSQSVEEYKTFIRDLKQFYIYDYSEK